MREAEDERRRVRHVEERHLLGAQPLHLHDERADEVLARDDAHGGDRAAILRTAIGLGLLDGPAQLGPQLAAEKGAQPREAVGERL